MPHDNEHDSPRLDELSQVTEALVFGADEPVQAERISQVYAEIRGVSRPSESEVAAAVDHLNTEYESTGHAIRIYRWADGFRMATIPETAPFLKVFLNQQRSRKLSRSLMEALAIVAYRQPVTKPEVDFVRGVDSDYALRKLMELEIVDVVGRSDAVGRPLLYGTTALFLDKFGLSSLENLPNLREVEELLSDPAFSSERARLLLRTSLFDSHVDDESADPDRASRESPEISVELRRADHAGTEANIDFPTSPQEPLQVEPAAHTNGNGTGVNGSNGNGSEL